MSMNGMSETVVFTRPGEYDDYTDTTSSAVDVAACRCVVYPAGDSDTITTDMDADTSRLIVLAPAGTPVEVDDEATIRGRVYRVVHIPWDWYAGRVPRNSMHTPRVQLTVEHKEG